MTHNRPTPECLLRLLIKCAELICGIDVKGTTVIDAGK